MESDSCTTDEEINNNTDETENTDSDYKDSYGKEDHEIKKSTEKHVVFDSNTKIDFEHKSDTINVESTENISSTWIQDKDLLIEIEKIKKEKRLLQEKISR